MAHDTVHNTADNTADNTAADTSTDPTDSNDTPAPPKPIDPRGPRFNQAVLTVGLLAAFAFQQPWVVIAFLVILGAGAVFGARYGLFLRIYADVIKPRLDPPADVEDPRPPRFAAVIGTVFLAGGAAAFALGTSVVGWVLALVVAALAGLAAVTGICVGCEVYTWLARHGMIRTKAPLHG